MNAEQENQLIEAISDMLLPLSSPYDLSKERRKIHWDRDPRFRNCVMQIFHLVTSNPMTKEKVLNDMRIMSELKMI